GSVPRAAPPPGAARGLEGGRMMDPLPFDHRRDAVLGRALREALDPGDAQAFVARVVAVAGQVRVASWDAVLARWARAGVAAALGPLRVRGGARAGPRARPNDGRAERRAAPGPGATRLGTRDPAAPPDPHDRRVGDRAPALRLDAGADGLRRRPPAHPGAAGQVPRPCHPVPASKGAGEGRHGVGRSEEMMAARRAVFGGIVSALVATGGTLAAQQKAPPAPVQSAQLQVSLAEAVRRALDVQPAVVGARGDQRNAGASQRAAAGAFLPT